MSIFFLSLFELRTYDNKKGILDDISRPEDAKAAPHEKIMQERC